MLLLAAAIALPLALLGRSDPSTTSPPQYERDVTAVLVGLVADFRGVGADRGAGAISARLSSMKAGLDHAAARLDSLPPPENVAELQRSLVAELRDYAREIDLVRASVDFGDPITIASHLREISAPAAINRTLGRLEAMGYRIPVRMALVGARGRG
jgi:hypothetical protein